MKRWLFSMLLITALLTGCDLFGPDLDQPLQGTINGVSFKFVSGFAATNSVDSTLWSVTLYEVSPDSSVQPWEPGAYPVTYPYLSFTVAKDSPPQEYEVSTFGGSSSSKPGIMLIAWTDALSGVFFDTGMLKITSIDQGTGTMTGQIDASTFDSSSSLVGTFSVPVDPASF